MKKTISCLIAAFCGTFALANASSDFGAMTPNEYMTPYSNSYSYICAGLDPILISPHVGLGYRQRFQSQLGWDSSLVFGTSGTIHQLGLNLMTHYYLHSEQHNSVYLGAGVRAVGFKQNHVKCLAGCIAVDSVIGKVLTSDGDSNQFIELHFCSPSVWSDKKVTEISGQMSNNFTAKPMVYLTYGVGF